MLLLTALASAILGGGLFQGTDAARSHNLVEVEPLQEDILSAELVQEMFNAFKEAYGRVYKEEEEEVRRFAIFNETLHTITKGNALGPPVFGINHFSDREESERPQRGRKGRGSLRFKDDPPLHMMTSGRQAKSVDWRTAAAVTPVKNQGQCGSCWAFSATAEIESIYAVTEGSQQLFSMQQVTSCTLQNLFGCDGGDTIEVYEYLLGHRPGLVQEEYYPYLQSLTELCLSTTCTFPCKSDDFLLYGVAFEDYIGPIASLSGWAYATTPCYDGCENQDLDTLAMAVSTTGPVSVCVNAGTWGYYVSGIMTSDQCGGYGYYDLDHCVQLVGFNYSCWFIRNSWDTLWGENGYIYIERADGVNTCGIADEATLVYIDSATSKLHEGTDAGNHSMSLIVHANGAIERASQAPAESDTSAMA